MSERVAAKLYRLPEGDLWADVECRIWVIEPREDQPGKWGGAVEVLQYHVKPSIADFHFRIELANGQIAEVFADIDQRTGRGTLDGDGPPPA